LHIEKESGIAVEFWGLPDKIKKRRLFAIKFMEERRLYWK